MKKWRMLFLLVAFASSAIAEDIRVILTSHTLVGDVHTVTCAVQLYSTFPRRIYSCKGQFFIGDGATNRPYTSLVLGSKTVFFDSDYDCIVCEPDDPNGYVQFEWVQTGAEPMMGDATLLPKTTWTTIFTVTALTVNKQTGLTTTFEWTNDGSYPNWGIEAWNAVLGEPRDVTGGQQVDPALIDLSLPVQMNEFVAKYKSGSGMQLDWVTQSEQNAAGFYMLRSLNPDGPFERVNNAMIPAHGTSSVMNRYSFVDKNVDWNKTYFYKLHEVSSVYGVADTNQTYYGPLSAQSGRAPQNFGLSQNYPNPFNPDTRFSFEITDPSFVTIKVYDLLGKEIRTLMNEYKAADVYSEVRWDGRDEFGNEAPSGIYIYRLTAGDKSEIRKMTKMK
jgi:hypothetical protein